ncbi:HD domain-containing protein [Thermodesulfobacteriota bacterium]
MRNSRLQKQLQFILEIDKLKKIVRQSPLADQSRKENDAEHSWHLAVMAILLSEYAKKRHMDIFHVVKLALIHDLVEIDAGDTFCYDKVGNRQKLERETHAADRIFNILPQDQARQMRALWDEFEARETPEACFAAALDRLQPLLLNFHTQGGTWREHDISRQQVIQRNSPMHDGAPKLWEYAEKLIDEAVEKGMLKK